MVIRILLLFYFCLISLSLYARQDNCFGKVIDAETGEVLPFATVAVISKSIGTITNSKGCFELQVESLHESDSIRVSYVGYKTTILLMSALKENSIILLTPETILLEEVTLSSNEFNISEFMQEVAKVYNENRRTTAHIAKATFEQYGKVDEIFAQYTMCSGHLIYFGEVPNVAKLALYSFVADQTNKSLRRPEWLKSSKQFRAERTDVPLMGEVGFNSYQYFEQIGPLSSFTGKYKYKLDSIYKVGVNEVYKVTFNAKTTFDVKARFTKGNIFVYANSKKLLSADVLGDLLWSTVLHERVLGKLHYEFVYYNDQPFLYRIRTQYKKKRIEERTLIQVDLQKFDEFKISVNELFDIRTLGANPWVIHDKYLINKTYLGVDFIQIQKDLGFKENLEQQFKGASGKKFWEYTKSGAPDERARKERAVQLVAVYKNFF